MVHMTNTIKYYKSTKMPSHSE